MFMRKALNPPAVESLGKTEPALEQLDLAYAGAFRHAAGIAFLQKNPFQLALYELWPAGARTHKDTHHFVT
jgi:hypothetical protein